MKISAPAIIGESPVFGAMPAERRRAAGFRRSPRLHLRRARGFTFIEILMVIGVVAMIMAIGIPAFVQDWRKHPLRAATKDLLEACKQARDHAILHGVTAELVLRGDGQIAVQAATPRVVDEFGVAGGGSVPAGSPFSGRLPEDVGVELLFVNLQDHLEMEEARVRFYPNGTSDEFAIILLHEGERRMISLEVITGLANLETDPNRFVK
jgi:prepilin-type N-terminal cleavage/methylation domain-containing protein